MIKGKMRLMNDAQKEELQKKMSLLTDWSATCKKCGKVRYGTIEELKKGCSCEAR